MFLCEEHLSLIICKKYLQVLQQLCTINVVDNLVIGNFVFVLLSLRYTFLRLKSFQVFEPWTSLAFSHSLPSNMMTLHFFGKLIKAFSAKLIQFKWKIICCSIIFQNYLDYVFVWYSYMLRNEVWIKNC